MAWELIHVFSVNYVSQFIIKMKTQNERIKELIEIRGILEQLGLFTIREFAEKIKIEMNAFVKDGYSSKFRWKLDNDTDIIIMLSHTKKSGVTMEKNRKS